jgi:dTDP-4-dehydrorhamnose reductase
MTLALPVLLFGANGQLGTRLHHALEAAGYKVTALGRAACDFATIDAKQIDAMIRTISYY